MCFQITVNDNNIEFVVTSEQVAFKLEKLSGSLKNSDGRKVKFDPVVKFVFSLSFFCDSYPYYFRWPY